MGKGESVTLETLAKICIALQCKLFDIMVKDIVECFDALTEFASHRKRATMLQGQG